MNFLPLQTRRVTVEEVLITRVWTGVCVLPECRKPGTVNHKLYGRGVDIRNVRPASRQRADTRRVARDPQRVSLAECRTVPCASGPPVSRGINN